MHSVTYEVDGRVATITLNRPDRLNAIDEHMPGEIRATVGGVRERGREAAQIRGNEQLARIRILAKPLQG